ncbi:hypothetical protein FN846DRAFT_888757 [Sphaerosporella brunnea]|uniref:Uncharacterized protein n=1 Tax=Sphaerosporella brunnea TaxID=1250544 RepID=A0A5J5F1X4_9PEZI|nr:hypothetical protein FN846DRAFT_888757 [Sphaerosporella brunnea]
MAQQLADNYFQSSWPPRRRDLPAPRSKQGPKYKITKASTATSIAATEGLTPEQLKGQLAFMTRARTAQARLRKLLKNIPALPPSAPLEFQYRHSGLVRILGNLPEKISYFFATPPPPELPPVQSSKVKDLNAAARMLLHVRVLRTEKREREAASAVLRALERLLKHKVWWSGAGLRSRRDWRRYLDEAMFEAMAVNERVKSLIAIEEYEDIEHASGTEAAEAWAQREAQIRKPAASQDIVTAQGGLMLPKPSISVVRRWL